MKIYSAKKAQARAEAQQWQTDFAERSISWGELHEDQKRFEALGKHYGLTREFRENGII